MEWKTNGLSVYDTVDVR